MVDCQQTKLNLKWCAQELNELQKANNWKFLDFCICFEPLLHGELIFMSVSSVRLLWLAAHLLGFTPSRGLFSPLLGCHKHTATIHQHNTLPQHTYTHMYTHIFKSIHTHTSYVCHQHTATTHTYKSIHTHKYTQHTWYKTAQHKKYRKAKCTEAYTHRAINFFANIILHWYCWC